MTEYKKYFEKIYEFQNNAEYVFPSCPSNLFKSAKWTISELQVKKQELNKVKGLLSKFQLKAWSKHTANRDPSGLVIKKLSENIQPELLTQAWCKFYEILSRFPIIPQGTEHDGKFSSLHLCEGPGAFVCALNHYLTLNYPNMQWKWMANTLNPNYEGNELSQMIPDDRFIRHTVKNWHFGMDFSGNITQYYNSHEITKSFGKEKVDLVTADGSVDCMKDPGEQEGRVAFLHYCETLTALSILRKGGTFVLKIFTIFEETTVNLLYLLNCLFEKVTIFKPCTSKSGNSEVYVINTNYKEFPNNPRLWLQLKIQYIGMYFNYNSMFFLTELPDCFLKEIHACVDFFMTKQIHTIRENIHYFKNKNESDPNKIYIIKNSVAELFISLYKLKSIPNDKKIVPDARVSDNWRVHPAQNSGSYKCLSAEDLQKCKITSDIIDVRVCKQIKEVQNSKFTHNDNLKNIVEKFVDRKTISGLYELVLRHLEPNNEIININEFNLHVYHRFQKDLFYRVCLGLNETKNIIFINVPFHTHFLVGLLYILFQAFEKVYFGDGVIILCKSTAESVRKAKDLLTLVDSGYKELDKRKFDLLFAPDLAQIIPASHFNETYDSIIRLIWNYNNQMFMKNSYTLQHFSHSKVDT